MFPPRPTPHYTVFMQIKFKYLYEFEVISKNILGCETGAQGKMFEILVRLSLEANTAVFIFRQIPLGILHNDKYLL
jgi:hypothetical protein